MLASLRLRACVHKMQTMSSSRLFFAVGTALTFAWLFLYADSTLKLINAVINKEPYYIDILPFYLLPYALIAFSALSYMDGIKRTSARPVLLIKQWINFVLLAFFALMQLFFSIAFFFVFFETFTKFEPVIEWLLIFLPITLLAFFMLLFRFLFQTRQSLSSSLSI